MAVYSVSLPADLDKEIGRIADKDSISKEEAIRRMTRKGIECSKKGGK